MHAIYAYLRAVVARAGQGAAGRRVLVQSDCLGVLDAIERAWRGGSPAPLRGLERGALLEAICRLRARLGLVVFMFTPSHVGIVPNAYADAAAKSHLSEPWEGDSAQQAILPHVPSRPCLYAVRSDFLPDGTLRPEGDDTEGAWILWDRRLFTSGRRRVARWLHGHMAEGLSGDALVESTFIGRRGHACEAACRWPIASLVAQSTRSP